MDNTIDAAGETQRFISISPIEPPPGQPILDVYAVTLDVTQSFDGNGMAVKKIAGNTVHGSQGGDQTTTHTTYLLRSSVLGGKVMAEIGSESDQRSFVYLGSAVLAVQSRPSQTVMWEHRDVRNGSLRMTLSNGTVATGGAELDPLGGDAGLSAPVTETPSPAQYWKYSSYPGLGGPTTSMNCIMDFIPTPCSEVGRAMNLGIAEQCENNYCGARIVRVRNSNRTIIGEGLAPLTRDPDSGRLGYSDIYTGPPKRDTPVVLRRDPRPPVPDGGEDTDDFTFADGQQNPIPYTTDETETLRKDLNTTLQGNCKNFVDALRKRISTPSNSARSSLDVFDDIRRQKGFFHVYEGLGWALGNIKDKDARIGLNAGFNTNTRVRVLIHELLHHGGTSSGFDHTTLGMAAWDVGGEQGLLGGLKNTNSPGPPREGTDEMSTVYNATLFDNILRAACGPK